LFFFVVLEREKRGKMRRNAEAREGADDEMRRRTKLRFSILFYRIKKK
jgi:hypothetical protein